MSMFSISSKFFGLGRIGIIGGCLLSLMSKKTFSSSISSFSVSSLGFGDVGTCGGDPFTIAASV